MSAHYDVFADTPTFNDERDYLEFIGLQYSGTISHSTPENVSGRFGWFRGDETIVVSQTPLSQAAPDLMAWSEENDNEDVFLMPFLWAFVPDWKPQRQKRGTCVGQSHKVLLDLIMSINATLGLSQWQGRCSVANNYAGGRVEAGRQAGRWDGSRGDWQKEYLLTKGGVLLLNELGLPDDARDEDEALAVQWAASRDGVPSEHEAKAKQKPVVKAYKVTSSQEAAAAIKAGGVVNRCSDLITTGKRDSNGFSPARRQGGHSQFFCGLRRKGGRGFPEVQSWGTGFASGPYHWEKQDPNGLGAGCIVDVSERDADAMLDDGDSYAFFGLHGMQPIPKDQLYVG